MLTYLDQMMQQDVKGPRYFQIRLQYPAILQRLDPIDGKTMQPTFFASPGNYVMFSLFGSGSCRDSLIL